MHYRKWTINGMVMSRPKFTTMVRIFILVLTLFGIILLNCHNRGIKKEELRCVKISFSMPGLDENGSLILLTDTMTKYVYKDLEIFQMMMFTSHQRTIVNINGDVIKQELISMDTSIQYVVHRKNIAKGIAYSSIDPKLSRSFDVDSFISTTWIVGFRPMYEISDSDTLVSAIKDGNTLKEVYRPKIKYGPSFNDSAYYYYRIGTHDDVSVLPVPSKRKGLNLYKMEVVYNEDPAVADPYLKQARRYLFECKEVPVRDPEKILGFVKRFEMDSGGKDGLK
jgi:hypothetical protein